MSDRPGQADHVGFAGTWVARRRDQLAVAVLVLAGLGGTLAWWLAQGGLAGRLGEVDQAEPQTAVFQVDLNAADWPELAALPGIGPTLAKRIVASRAAEGPFPAVEDLCRVRGIGPLTLARVRSHLVALPRKAAAQ